MESFLFVDFQKKFKMVYLNFYNNESYTKKKARLVVPRIGEEGNVYRGVFFRWRGKNIPAKRKGISRRFGGSPLRGS